VRSPEKKAALVEACMKQSAARTAAELVVVTADPALWERANPEMLAFVERVNAPGPLREAFLSFVQANAAALAGRWQEIPRAYRAPSIRIHQGVERTPLSLAGLDPAVSAAHPALRQAIERVGCAACHTADADFVHLRPGRGPSPFYVKELSARVDWLARAAQGLAPQAPFGPLQKDPVLP
jgi:mono/diheme cytochrome c family protein